LAKKIDLQLAEQAAEPGRTAVSEAILTTKARSTRRDSRRRGCYESQVNIIVNLIYKNKSQLTQITFNID
jgi:hypothetical protein